MTQLFANNATSRLASAITSGAASLSLVTGGGASFPTLSGGNTFKADIIKADGSAREIVLVTARSSDTLSITRAQEGTGAAAFAAGDTVEVRLTAGWFDDLTTLLAAKQPLDSDLTAIAALTTTSFGRALLALADAAAGRTAFDAYSTSQVDAAIATAVNGLSWKQAVRVATTVAGTLASSFENGDTIDGVTLATGNRILIKNQSSGSENGIYVVAASGAPTRATDADSGAELVNASVYVSEGTANADTQWTCTTNATITVNSTSLAFAQLATGGPPTGSAGGDLTGTYPNPTLATSITTLTDGATVTWTVTGKREDMAQLTIAGTRTLAISGASAGFRGVIHITESGASRSLALPGSSIVANTGAGAIALSGTSGGKQKWTVSYDGTNYWWEFGATYT